MFELDLDRLRSPDPGGRGSGTTVKMIAEVMKSVEWFGDTPLHVIWVRDNRPTRYLVDAIMEFAWAIGWKDVRYGGNYTRVEFPHGAIIRILRLPKNEDIKYHPAVRGDRYHEFFEQ